MLGTGEFTIEPTGTVLKAAPFPEPGQRGGPTMQVTVRNITGTPVRISARLLGLAPELDDVVTVRGSVAGAVILRGSLSDAATWTEPAGMLPSGATSTLRIRFKLRKGLDPDEFAGRLDIRQLEIKGALPGKAFEAPSDVQQVVPGTEGSAPATTSAAPTTPAAGARVPAPSPATTPQPPSSIPPRTDEGPKRRAPDEGAE